jgi:hypothetical protein
LQQAQLKPRIRMQAAVEAVPVPELEEPLADDAQPLAEISKRETTVAGPAEVIALQRRLLRVPQDVSDEDAPFDPPDTDDLFGFAECEADAPFDAPDLNDEDVFQDTAVPELVSEPEMPEPPTLELEEEEELELQPTDEIAPQLAD